AERLCDRLAIIDQGRVIACDSPSALIRAEIEPHVVELSGHGATVWLDAQGQVPGAERLHRVGDVALIYTRDPRPVLDRLDADGVRYLHRPANLEDVFLKLTGHELRD